MSNYKLSLLDKIYIYLIFYILLLKPALKDIIIITLQFNIKVYKEDYKLLRPDATVAGWQTR